MRRGLQLAIIISLLAGTALGQFRYGLNVNGTAGLGMDYNTSSTNGGESQNNLGWYRDFGFTGTGFVYDERLLLYNLGVSLGHNNNDNLVSTSTADYLEYNGNFNFLSERDFPFSIYFSRASNSNGTALFPVVTTLSDRYGIQGAYHHPGRPNLFYNLSREYTRQESDVAQIPSTGSSNGQITGTYKLDGWDLRGAATYLRQSLGGFVETATPNVIATNTTFEGDVSRQFGLDKRLDFTALHSTFHDPTISGLGSGNTSLNVLYDWRLNKKLQTSYFANYTQTNTNVVQVLEQTTGQPGPDLPYNPSSLSTDSYGAGTRVNYQLFPSLMVHGDMAYNHINFSEQQLALTDPNTPTILTDGNISFGGGYNFHHKLWKFMYTSDGTVSNQRYTYVGGDVTDARNWSFTNGISGGDVRTVRYSASGGYSHRSSPLLFVLATTDILNAEARAETNRFDFVRFSGSFQLTHETFDLNTSNNRLLTTGVSFSATIPSWRVGAYGSIYRTNGTNFLFGTNSPLNQPTGSIPTSQILIPQFLTQTSGTRLGANWSPTQQLEIQTQFVHDRFFYSFENTTLTFASEWDTVVSYKFGRFTFYGGYSRGGNVTGAQAGSTPFDTSRNRFFVQVRFPFHVMGMGR
jgi:hypothetical protein